MVDLCVHMVFEVIVEVYGANDDVYGGKKM